MTHTLVRNSQSLTLQTMWTGTPQCQQLLLGSEWDLWLLLGVGHSLCQALLSRAC